MGQANTYQHTGLSPSSPQTPRAAGFRMCLIHFHTVDRIYRGAVTHRSKADMTAATAKVTRGATTHVGAILPGEHKQLRWCKLN